MPNYRRARTPGATYFFTVTLADRESDLLVTSIDALRTAIRATLLELPCRVDAMAVLPDHLHCVWTLPPGDADFSTRWQRIKGRFTYEVVHRGPAMIRNRPTSSRKVWQRGFWEHLIRDDDDYAAHIDYIHYNPVRHGYVERVVDWPHSTFHRFCRAGVYSADWCSTAGTEGEFGERG